MNIHSQPRPLPISPDILSPPSSRGSSTSHRVKLKHRLPTGPVNYDFLDRSRPILQQRMIRPLPSGPDSTPPSSIDSTTASRMNRGMGMDFGDDWIWLKQRPVVLRSSSPVSPPIPQRTHSHPADCSRSPSPTPSNTSSLTGKGTRLERWSHSYGYLSGPAHTACTRSCYPSSSRFQSSGYPQPPVDNQGEDSEYFGDYDQSRSGITENGDESNSHDYSFRVGNGNGPSTMSGAVAGYPNGRRMQRKILIMGSRSVGKSSLTIQYVEPNSFSESYYPTIEAVHNKEIVFEGTPYDCEIIDTAGQDEYSLFNHKYAVGIHGYVLVYSIASRQSFEMIKTLHNKITEFQGVDTVCCVIVGQKSDLGESRQVKLEEGAALAKKLGAAFIETSAKDNKHINDVFNLLMIEMRKVYNPPEEKKKASWWSSWMGGGK